MHLLICFLTLQVTTTKINKVITLPVQNLIRIIHITTTTILNVRPGPLVIRIDNHAN